jgi:hypothetical protein
VASVLNLGCGENIEESKHSIDEIAALHSTERSVDLGVHIASQDAAFTFKILNSSGKKIKILSVQKTCGCIAFELETERIVNPKSMLEVPIVISGDAHGLKREMVIITTDSEVEELREIRLVLSVEFPKAVWAEPPNLVFNTGFPTKPCRLRVRSNFVGLVDSFSKVSIPDFLSMKQVLKTSDFIDFEFAIDESKLKSDWAIGVVTFHFLDARYPVYRVTAKCDSPNTSELIDRLEE